MTKQIWGLLLLISALWSSSFIFVEILLMLGIDPILTVFLRLVSGAIIFIFYAIIKKMNMILTINDWGCLIIISLLNNIIPFLAITHAQQSITGGLASILNSATALIALLLGIIFVHEKLTLHRIIGISIGIIGTITAVGWHNLLNFSDSLFAPFLVILASTSYGFATIWGKTKLKHLPPMIAAGGMMICSAIIITIIVLWHYHHIPSIIFDINILSYGFIFGFLTSFVAYIIYYKILSISNASNVTLSTIIIPPMVIILDMMLLGQILSLYELLGCGIIIIGLIIIDGRLLKSSNNR